MYKIRYRLDWQDGIFNSLMISGYEAFLGRGAPVCAAVELINFILRADTQVCP